MSFFAVLLLAFLATALLTLLFISLSKNGLLLDVPISRSSHTIPTPKGGGIVFVLVILAFLIQGAYLETDGSRYITTLFVVLASLMALSGFLDDILNLPISLRMLFHAVAVLVFLILTGLLPEINLSGLIIRNEFILYPVTVFVLVWLINLFNFMDGIDGLAVTEAFFIFVTAGAMLLLQGANHGLIELLLLIAVCLAGFMPFNLPTARVFMGDTGSVFLGFVIGLSGLITVGMSSMTIWAWSILLGVFVVDSSTTLITRMLGKSEWFSAHRSHAYQHAAIRFGSHGLVVSMVALINIAWLLPLAWLSIRYPDAGAWLTVLAYIPLFLIARHFRAGKDRC